MSNPYLYHNLQFVHLYLYHNLQFCTYITTVRYLRLTLLYDYFDAKLDSMEELCNMELSNNNKKNNKIITGALQNAL